MAATAYAPMSYDLLPLPAHNSSLTAWGGYFVKSIDVYEVIIHDTVPRDDLGQIVGERIQDQGAGLFVQRTLRAIHIMVITNRDGFRTIVTVNIQAARDAVLFHEQRPDQAWEAPNGQRLHVQTAGSVRVPSHSGDRAQQNPIDLRGP